MLLAEHPLLGLQVLRLERLGLLPPALVPICRYRVVHARQGFRMLVTEYPLSRVQDLQ
jgi:hypothetical protein